MLDENRTMEWRTIRVAKDGLGFLFHDQPLWQGRFRRVLKFHAPGLAPVLGNEGWYHIDIHGQPVYPERYDRAFGYYNDRAAVCVGDDWFHIDPLGRRVGSQSFAWCGNFQEGRCPVRASDGSYHHIQIDGTSAYSEIFRYAGDFRDGVACVKMMDGLFMHIDPHGQPIHDGRYLELGPYHKGIATALDQEGWFHIDDQGKELYRHRFRTIEPFYNGQALVRDLDGKQLVLDELGRTALAV